MHGRQDWANLPPDMITLISEKASITNTMYVHLRAVCKGWRSSLTPHPRHLPRQSPWLLLPRLGVHDFRLRFYNPSLCKSYHFNLPCLSGKYIYNSYGWFVLNHGCRVSLFNPITGNSFDLPSLDAMSKSERAVPNVPHYCLQKVLLSCNPSEPDFFVVAWFLSWSDWELGFCRIGDTHWNGLKKRDGCTSLLDFTCHRNSVYTVNCKKEVSVYDLQSLTVWTYPSKIIYYPNYQRINLVEGDGESGGPLVVITYECHGNNNLINVYKWYEYDSQQQWCLVMDIGKRALFLNRFNCTNLQLEGTQGNAIYYDASCPLDLNSFRVSINRVFLKSGSVLQHNLGPLVEFPTICGWFSWFTPSLI
ncbi:F-box protein skip23 [Rhynchospora pubera]|uniref:F-box protein skip23 n=1 Tax=Rhynchospora pubera TaxID=906938 RepID=A0AAV8F1G7_9POAL|nr:F-box protein skip23 [Rhynchospora pubera]